MIVLDASVVIKWFQKEEDSERALLFEERHSNGEETIAVPDLLFYEFTNVLRYQKSITQEAAHEALQVLQKMGFRVYAFSPDQMKEVFDFARKYDVSVYDSLYAVLATHLECPLVTADESLCRKLKGFAWVKLLSE